jgi:ABC-type transport system involved in multi-copper enzyme maturation permease subunit
VLFFVPGIAAGAIAGERERQTLATLQVTLLRPRSIVAGKIVAALAYLVLLIVASLPVLAAAYVLGGIRVADIARGVLAVSAVALFVATIVVAVSAFARRVQTATVLAYAVTVLLVVAGPLAAGIAAVFDARSESSGHDEVVPPAVLLTVTPIALVADAVAGVDDNGPLSALHEGILDVKNDNDGRWFALFPDNAREVRPDDERQDSGAPIWLLSMVSMTVLAAASFVGAARRLRTPASVER